MIINFYFQLKLINVFGENENKKKTTVCLREVQLMFLITLIEFNI